MEDLTTVQVGDGAVGEDGDCDADDVSEVSLFFFCNSRKHLEQQSPVALFPCGIHREEWKVSWKNGAGFAFSRVIFLI